MKNKLSFLIIVIILFSCKKREINKDFLFYIKNNTSDTLKITYSYDFYILNGSVFHFQGTRFRDIVISPHKLEEIMPYISYKKIDWINYMNIYSSDTLIVRFRKDSLPYNYKKNFYDKTNWDEHHYYYNNDAIIKCIFVIDSINFIYSK